MNSFARFEPLVEALSSSQGMKKLHDSKIAVFGLGGVGSYTAEALARSGIGTLVLIDGDVIEESNLNRQLYALNSTIGKKKSEVAKMRILDINPKCNVEIFSEFILPENFEQKLGEDFFSKVDFIIDAVDTVALKIFLAVESEKKSIPIISAMSCGNRLNANFEFADIYKTSVCPLCKVMRGELRKREVKNLKVLYSKEPALIKQNPPASSAWAPSVAGLLIAGEAIKTILA